jgi:hypothetical protein
MTSLVDLAGRPRVVEVNGISVEVKGISVRGLAALSTRFPDGVGKLLSGGQPDRAALIKLGPDILGAVIAAGIGKPGDPKEEAIANDLGLEAQLDLFEEVMKMTFPRGMGPFVKKLQSLGLLVKADPASLSLTPSQEASTSSSPKDTTLSEPMPGTIPPGK